MAFAAAADLDALRADLVQVWAKLESMEANMEEMGNLLTETVEEKKFQDLDARDENKKLDRLLKLMHESLQTCHEELRALKHGGRAAPKRKRAEAAEEAPKKTRGGRKKQRRE
jgi:hypothetical protein